VALASATFPYLLELCERGLDDALGGNPALAAGVNCYRGQVTHAALAAAQNRPLAATPWLAAAPH
jgi:alanine dehydrogenase